MNWLKRSRNNCFLLLCLSELFCCSLRSFWRAEIGMCCIDGWPNWCSQIKIAIYSFCSCSFFVLLPFMAGASEKNLCRSSRQNSLLNKFSISATSIALVLGDESEVNLILRCISWFDDFSHGILHFDSISNCNAETVFALRRRKIIAHFHRPRSSSVRLSRAFEET